MAILAVFLYIAGARPVAAQQDLFVYVPNFNDNTVSVLETTADGTATAQTTVSGVGSTILSVTVRGDQAYAYVSSRATNQLFVVDTQTNNVVQTVATGGQPAELVFSPNGTRAYLANNGSTVGVYDVDALTGQLTSVTTVSTGAGSGARGITVSSDGTRVYAGDQQLDRVIVIDTSNNSVLTTVTVGDQPLGIGIKPDGSRLYVTNFTDSTLSVIDTATDTVVATASLDFGGTLGRGPDGVAVSPDGKYVYVANRTTGNVSVLDASTNATVGIISAGPQANGVVVSPDGTDLYVTSHGGSDRVNAFTIDTSTGLLTANGTAAVGDSPVNLGMCSGSGLLGSGGTFLARTSGALGCAGSSASFTGGTLAIGASNLAISSALNLGSGGGTIDTNGNSATVSGGISGTGSLTKSGAGTLTLTGTNTYSGVTTVETGTLRAGAANAFSPNSTMSVNSGAVLDLNGFDQAVGALAGAGGVTPGGATLTAGGNGASTTFSGTITGSGSLIKTGSGTLTLSGANTFSGSTTVSRGTLRAGAADTFSSNSTMSVNSGAVLDLSGFNQTVGALAGAGSVTPGGATLTAGGDGSSTAFSGTITGSGSLTKAGSGTLTLSGANTLSGGTTVSGGTLQAGAADTFSPNSTMTVNSEAVLDLNGFDQSIGALAGAGGVTPSGATLTAGGDGTSTTFSGTITGSGSLTKAGSGTLTLSGANTFSGSTTVSAGTLRAGVADAFSPDSSMTVNAGAALDLNGFDQTLGALAGAGSVTPGGATLITGGDGTSTTFSGATTGSGNLTKTGIGALTLSGANSFIGSTTVSGGTLRAGAADAFSPNSSMTIKSGAVLDLNSFDQTVGALAGAGGVTPGGATLTTGGDGTSTTFSGAITGTGNLTKTGSGMLTLNGVNSFSGITTVSGGTLAVGDAAHEEARLGGSVSVENGARLIGHGTIGGTLRNQAAGSVAPGGSIGTLRVEGDYVQGPDGTLSIELSPTQTSVLEVGGMATLDGALVLVYQPGTYGTAIYTIIDASAMEGEFASIEADTPEGLVAVTDVVGSNVLHGLFRRDTAPPGTTILTAMGSVALRTGNQVGDILMDRLSGGSAGRPAAAGAVLASQAPTPAQLTAAVAGGAPTAGDLAPYLPDFMRALGGWVHAYGVQGEVEGDTATPGFDTRTAGFVGGFQRPLGDGFLAGLAGGYSHTTVREGEDNSGRLDTPRAALYGSWETSGMVIGATLGYAHHVVQTDRPVATGRTAEATWRAHELMAGMQASAPLQVGPVSLLPRVGLRYMRLFEQSVSEDGAGAFGVAADTRTPESLRPFAGIGIAYSFNGGGGLHVVPSLEATYSRELLDAAPDRRVSLGGADFAVPGLEPARDRAIVGGGVDLEFDGRLRLHVGYSAELPIDNAFEQRLQAALTFRF